MLVPSERSEALFALVPEPETGGSVPPASGTMGSGPLAAPDKQLHRATVPVHFSVAWTLMMPKTETELNVY